MWPDKELCYHHLHLKVSLVSHQLESHTCCGGGGGGRRKDVIGEFLAAEIKNLVKIHDDNVPKFSSSAENCI